MAGCAGHMEAIAARWSRAAADWPEFTREAAIEAAYEELAGQEFVIEDRNGVSFFKEG